MYVKEYWIDVKEVPGYQVSNLGRVRNSKTYRLLKQIPNREGGYNRVKMAGKHRYVHRLVADSFFDGDHSDMEVRHRDGDKTNNFIGNLRWDDKRKAT